MQYAQELGEPFDVEQADAAFANELPHHSQQVYAAFTKKVQDQAKQIKDTFFKQLILLYGDFEHVQYATSTRQILLDKTMIVVNHLQKECENEDALLAIFQKQKLKNLDPEFRNKLAILIKSILMMEDMIRKPLIHALADAGKFEIIQQACQYIPPLYLSSIMDPSMQQQNLMAKAAAQGNTTFLKFVLKNDCKSHTQYVNVLNVRDSLQLIPIYYACLVGKLEMVEFLLQVMEMEVDVPAMICCACQTKQLDIVKHLLQLYKNRVNTFEQSEEQEQLFQGDLPSALACAVIDDDMQNFLSKLANKEYASFAGNAMDLVPILIKHKFNFLPQTGRSPLICAVLANNVPLVAFLSQHFKPLIEYKDETGLKAIHYAVKNRAMFDALVKHGAKVDYQGEDGAFLIRNSAANAEMFTHLIELGAPFDIVIEGEQVKPIHVACEAGSLESVQVLVAKQVALDQLDEQGSSVLHFAAKSENVQLMLYLLQQKSIPSLECKNTLGSKPLHVALLSNLSPDMVKVILQQAGNVGLHEPMDNDYLKTVLPIHFAAQTGEPAMAQVLLDFGATLELAGGEESLTPLEMAFKKESEAGSNDAPVSELLLKKGAKPVLPSNKQDTCLTVAAQFGWLSIVQFLIEKCNIAVDQVNANKETAFLIAVLNHHFAVAEYLLGKSANINILHAHLGKLKQNRAALEWLVEHNAIKHFQ